MNNLNKYSYKVLNFIEHNKFIKDNIYKRPITHCINGKTYLFSNVDQLKKYVTSNYLNQSCVLYKFDNDKINNLNFCDKKQLFLTNEILYDYVILEKKIFFDVNRIDEYFYDIQNINKYLSNS